MLTELVAIFGFCLAIWSGTLVGSVSKVEKPLVCALSIVSGFLGMLGLFSMAIDSRSIPYSSETNLWGLTFVSGLLSLAVAFCLTFFVMFLTRLTIPWLVRFDQFLEKITPKA